jgi:hypothetical protein
MLHQDWWNWKRIDPRFLGFLPIGLVYHAGYCLAASLTCWLLVRHAWPRNLEPRARDPEAPGISFADGQTGRGRS